MSAKKLSAEQKEAEEFDGSADLGSVITRTVKKAAVKKASQKKTASAAEVESREEELHSCGAIAFTSEFIERLVLLFGLPVVLCFCKCALVWAYADGNDEMADLLAAKYSDLRGRHEALKAADEA